MCISIGFPIGTSGFLCRLKNRSLGPEWSAQVQDYLCLFGLGTRNGRPWEVVYANRGRQTRIKPSGVDIRQLKMTIAGK